MEIQQNFQSATYGNSTKLSPKPCRAESHFNRFEILRNAWPNVDLIRHRLFFAIPSAAHDLIGQTNLFENRNHVTRRKWTISGESSNYSLPNGLGSRITSTDFFRSWGKWIYFRSKNESVIELIGIYISDTRRRGDYISDSRRKCGDFNGNFQTKTKCRRLMPIIRLFVFVSEISNISARHKNEKGMTPFFSNDTWKNKDFQRIEKDFETFEVSLPPRQIPPLRMKGKRGTKTFKKRRDKSQKIVSTSAITDELHYFGHWNS